MPKFGRTSTTRLNTCHPLLQELFREVVKEYDCSILEGARSKERQKMLVASGKSKTMNSKHIPKNGVSWAVDVVPYPIAWGDKEQKELLTAMTERNTEDLNRLLLEYRLVFARFYHFAGYVKGVADNMGIQIRSGLDWDGDNDLSDNSFIDCPHFELLED